MDGLADTARNAQDLKSLLVEGVHERVDLNPYVEHWRGGRWIATVQASGPNEIKDWTLPVHSTELGVMGWATDDLRVVIEVVTRTVHSRAVAETIQRGDMARDFRENPDSDVSQALHVTRVWREDGAVRNEGVMLPYCYAETLEGVTLRWAGSTSFYGEQQGRGVDALRRAMAPRLDVRDLVGIVVGENPEQELLDRATANAITSQFGHSVTLTPGKAAS